MTKQQTLSQYIRNMGLESVVQFSRMTGVSVQTLNSWHTYRPMVIHLMAVGALTKIPKKPTIDDDLREPDEKFELPNMDRMFGRTK